MIISSGSAHGVDEAAVHRCKATAAKVNETGTMASGMVHFDEIAVIFAACGGAGCLAEAAKGLPGSLAVSRSRRYKRRNSHQRCSRTNHGD
jgi:hypothetical protein